MPHDLLKRTTNGVQEQYRVHLLGFDHTQLTSAFKVAITAWPTFKATSLTICLFERCLPPKDVHHWMEFDAIIKGKDRPGARGVSQAP
jgi:hypothetical protein